MFSQKLIAKVLASAMAVSACDPMAGFADSVGMKCCNKTCCPPPTTSTTTTSTTKGGCCGSSACSEKSCAMNDTKLEYSIAHDLADFGVDSLDSMDDATVSTTETTTCCPAPGKCCGSSQCGVPEDNGFNSSGAFNQTQSAEELFNSYEDEQCGMFCQASKGINDTLGNLFGGNSTMCDAPKFDDELNVDEDDDDDSHYDSL